MNKVCVNYSLPHYKSILNNYGEDVGIELISYINSKRFIDWYGNDDFPNIYNDYIINSKNDKKHVSEMLQFTKSLFQSSKVNKNIRTNNVLTRDEINVKLNEIKSKSENNLTQSERDLLSGKTNINKFFKLTDNIYKPDNKFDEKDFLFEVLYKLDLYGHAKYKPLINFIKDNISNYDIKFGVINNFDEYSEHLKEIGSDFYAFYDPETNEIKLNKYLLEKDNKIIQYDNEEINDYIMHELVHAFTLFRFEDDDKFNEEMDNILNHIKDNLTLEELDLFNEQLSNAEEMIAWSFHDINFQKLLLKIPSLHKNETIYDTYINSIKETFNLSSNSIIDDIFYQTFDTINNKKIFDDDINSKLNTLKTEIVNTLAQYNTSSEITNLLLDNLNINWISYKFDNGNSFNNFRKDILDKLNTCFI
jgi:hypothetical protein